MTFFVTNPPLEESTTLFVGGSNTVGIPAGGWRVDYVVWLNKHVSDSFPVSMAMSGVGSWYHLMRMAQIVAAAPTHLVLECGVNDSMYGNGGISERENGFWPAAEALIRQVRLQLPNTRIIFINLGGEDPYIDQTDIDARILWETVAPNYDVDHISFNQYLRDLVGGGDVPDEATYDLYHDGAHFTILGHHTIFDAMLTTVQADYPGSPGWTGDLDDYAPVYDDVDDWMGEPIQRLGADNDGESGTWSDNDIYRESSEAEATITWVGTFTSWGLAIGQATCTFQWQIDGGDWNDEIGNSALPAARMFYSLANGEHTLIIKVKTGTVQIQKFLAV